MVARNLLAVEVGLVYKSHFLLRGESLDKTIALSMSTPEFVQMLCGFSLLRGVM